MTTEKQEEKKVQPVYKQKEGAIDGVVWENERDGPTGKFMSYNINIEKSFTRDDGQTWEKSKGYFAQDIDNLEKVITGIKTFFKETKVRTNVKKRE